jgi:hypothetical protein
VRLRRNGESVRGTEDFGVMPWKWKFWDGWETPLFLKGRSPRELVDESLT